MPNPEEMDELHEVLDCRERVLCLMPLSSIRSQRLPYCAIGVQLYDKYGRYLLAPDGAGFGLSAFSALPAGLGREEYAARLAAHLVPLGAGELRFVAKTFVESDSAIAHLFESRVRSSLLDLACAADERLLLADASEVAGMHDLGYAFSPLLKFWNLAAG